MWKFEFLKRCIVEKFKFLQILLGDKNATSLCSKNISTLSQLDSGLTIWVRWVSQFHRKKPTIDLVDELDFYEQENDENTEIENTEIEKKLKKKAKIKNKLVKKVKKEVIEDEDDDKEHQCYRWVAF